MTDQEPQLPRISGTGKFRDDSVLIAVDSDRHTVTIQSPRGISEVILHRLAAQWPERVVVRLHLKGLEDLTVEGGGVIVRGAVSREPETNQIRQWVSPDESVVLTANDPFWLDLRVEGGVQGEHRNGFQWTLPWGHRRANPTRVRVAFVDFFR